jgi:cellulase/cellobiase CelA1
MAWFPRVSQRMMAMIAAGELVVIVALGYMLLRAQGAGHGLAANYRLERAQQAYEKWVSGFASGLGDRRAVVILEPDALAQLNNCSDKAQRQARLQMLTYAVTTLQTKRNQVYLDAGHSNWVPAAQMARRLRAADVAHAYGFALNVSNYDPTDREIGYAIKLDRNLGMAKRFVVDTSRNGQGRAGGRAHLGVGSTSRALPGAGRGALGTRLFRDPNSEAAHWVRGHRSDPRAQEIRQRIANQPTAKWFGAWSGSIAAAVEGYTRAASREHKVPVLVTYDIPRLGCRSTSGAGARQWCNPPGRELGSVPQVLDDHGDMGLWLKTPGESDGNCGVGAGTRMGEFSPVIATELITGKS